jgi:hypothetical protein
MYSGWGAKVGAAAACRGVDGGGHLHYPGLGVDGLSIDPGTSMTFDTHLILAGAAGTAWLGRSGPGLRGLVTR